MKTETQQLAAKFTAARAGKDKGIKYPAQLRAKAVELFRAQTDLGLAAFAEQLSVSTYALSRWLQEFPEPSALMVPVQVAPASDTLGAGGIVVGFGGVTLTLPEGVGPDFVARVVRSLAGAA